jgi:hypothetical protein
VKCFSAGLLQDTQMDFGNPLKKLNGVRLPGLAVFSAALVYQLSEAVLFQIAVGENRLIVFPGVHKRRANHTFHFSAALGTFFERRLGYGLLLLERVLAELASA